MAALVGPISDPTDIKVAVFCISWGKSTPFEVGIEKPSQVERATPIFFFRIRDRPSPGREKVERPKYLFFFSRTVKKIRALL